MPSRPAPGNQSFQNGTPTSPTSDRTGAPTASVATSVSSRDPRMAQPTLDRSNIVRRKLAGYVGFANLPNQWHRKSVRKGFHFNVLVVGKVAT